MDEYVNVCFGVVPRSHSARWVHGFDDKNSHLSENSELYVLRTLGLYARIGKRSPVGQEMGQLVDAADQEDPSMKAANMQAAIHLVTKHLTPENFFRFLDYREAFAFRDGEAHARQRIRKALGISL